MAWVLAQGGDVIVRHQGANFPLLDRTGKEFDLLAALRGLQAHQPGTWPARFAAAGRSWEVWLHGVRKSAAAAQHAKEELRKERGAGVQPQTPELAEYVVALTSLNPATVAALRVLFLYRGRWQIELVFKRLKSLLGVGELAKYDPDSARAWLQAKLLTALLLEREAFLFSPGDTRCWERPRWREFREVRDSFLPAVPRPCHSNNCCAKAKQSDRSCANGGGKIARPR